MAGQETEEKPLHLFKGTEMAALSRARAVHHRPCGRHWHAVPIVSTLLCLRTYCHLPAATSMGGLQQCTGKYSGTLRQLCVLSCQQGRSQLLCDNHHRRLDLGHLGCPRMEVWTYLLQHHLSHRYHPILLEPFLVPEDSLRRKQMSQLFAMHQELQGCLHRFQDAQRGL